MRNMIKMLFFPPFLQRIDEKLLLNRPWLWATRLHRVAWPALLLAVVAAAAGWFTPIDMPYQIDSFLGFGTLAILIAQVGLVIYWLYGQDSYHVEREHGASRDARGWREFGTYTVAFSLIAVSLFGFFVTAQLRVQTVDKSMLARDLFLLTMIENMENRDNYLHAVINEYMPYYEWTEEMPYAQQRANTARDREYQRVNSMQETYKTRLNNAASLFTLDTREILLERYFFENPYYNDEIHSQPNVETPYWDRTKFVETYLDMADFAPLQAAWAQGDYSALFDLIARYRGDSAVSLTVAWDEWTIYDDTYTAHATYDDGHNYHNQYRSQFNDLEWPTLGNAKNMLNFGFNNEHFARNFWAVIAAIAIHLGLLRFTFKHSGLKGFLLLFGGVVAIGISAMVYGVVGEIFSYRLNFDGRFGGLDFMRWYGLIGLCLGLGMMLISLVRTRRIATQTRYSHFSALALYLLPLLLIITPYLLFGLEELLTDWHGRYGWFSKHFLESNPHTTANFVGEYAPTWSYAPLGWYILYFVQFAYLPFIGWLKQKHTRLMSLPR